MKLRRDYNCLLYTSLPEGSNVCEVPTKNIIVNDSPEGMQVSFDTAKIEIRVKKTSDDLADLTEGDIKASIDLKGMSEGSYAVSYTHLDVYKRQMEYRSKKVSEFLMGTPASSKQSMNLQKQQKLSLKMADGRNIHLNSWMNWNLLMQ